MTLNPNTPIFFKKLPRTEKTPTDAVYLRFIANIPNQEVHEILWHGEKWKVGSHQFWTIEEGLRLAAEGFSKEIEAARAATNGTKFEMASHLCISVGTMTDRMKLVQNHLGRK